PLDTTGANLGAMDEIYPEAMAPVILSAAHGQPRRLETMRWGWPPFGEIKRPITNVRNLASPMWRSALADPARRCLVPATAFSEWSAKPDPATGRKRKHWFALADDSPFAFAGLWRPTVEGPRFAFLTAAPNAMVGAIHPKAMPVLLTPGALADAWLSGDGAVAAAMQQPFPDAEMRELATEQLAPTNTPAPRPREPDLFG
uniref:SOS response-associated peptidase n=1 Tax=Novosphingobium sp. TaxID=1874826 RepID=UPI0025D123DD